MNAETEQIRMLVVNINKSWRLGRSERLQNFFHPDMIILGPGFQETCKGRKACVDSYREFTERMTVQQYNESDYRIYIWDNMAVCNYSWTMSYLRDDIPNHEEGTDQFVFVRQGNKWLVVWRYNDIQSMKH